MIGRIICGCLSLAAVALVRAVSAQTSPRSAVETPQAVTPCALEADPAAYNQKLIEVTAFVSHGFENFSLSHPGCTPSSEVWLEYGGRTTSGTVYCCGVGPDRSRPVPLTVEGLTVPLVQDQAFHEFDARIQRPGNVLLRASLIGRFFSGRKEHLTAGDFWQGYGHLGCCSLLAIQQVLHVDPADRTDVDYDPVADQPKVERSGCGFRGLNGAAFDAARQIAAQ